MRMRTFDMRIVLALLSLLVVFGLGAGCYDAARSGPDAAGMPRIVADTLVLFETSMIADRTTIPLPSTIL
jgi:hypothetical protein